MEFKKLGIEPQILRVLEEQSYTSPTPIQEKTIPAAIEGKDVLGLAQTGTGKTAAFAVPTLQILARKRQSAYKHNIRCLVLTPTRELALQVYESFETYGRYLPLKSTVVFGGVGQGSQVKALKAGVDILVATPGRLIDLINQGHIDISSIEIFILDEADRMLDMGFLNDVRRIIKLLPNKKQTLLFSATMPKEMHTIVNQVLVDPVEVSVTPVSSTVDMIEQSVCFVDQKRKIDLLGDILKEHRREPILVFARTKRSANRIAKELGKRNVAASAIHGDKSQSARQQALDKFKSGKLQALIATDIASRGIDINDLKYVVNYDLPEVPETYVHRIGRTGRAGNEGMAITLCSHQEKHLLKDIEKLIKKDIPVRENTKYPILNTAPKEKKQTNTRNTPKTNNPRGGNEKQRGNTAKNYHHKKKDFRNKRS